MNYGKVTKLNAWKNKNGYFVGILAVDKSTPTDYMYYGTPDVKINDDVEFETGKPSPDGKPTLKTLRPASIDSDLPSAKDYYDAEIKRVAHERDLHAIAPSKEARQYVEEVKAKYQPTDKDATITRLACIKAACELLHGVSVRDRADEVIAVARRFEKYAKDG